MVEIQKVAMIQTGVFAKATPRPNALYLQQSDFDEDGLLYDTIKPTITIDNSRHLLLAGDLLLASKGNYNRCVIFPDIKQKCVASPSFLVIRLYDKFKTLPEYVAWYLNLSIIQNALANRARGTSIMSISKATLEELVIPIPSVDCQRQYIQLAKLQKREQELYKAIAEKRKQLLEWEMLKNI